MVRISKATKNILLDLLATILMELIENLQRVQDKDDEDHAKAQSAP